MGQAAAANVLQFFVPGQGDPEQFYNLPRRAVFDPLTALLALIGIGVLLWRWRQPAALFLLTWFPALLLPSFLATDRWPTLPRVLGVIPAVYFYPAVGLLFVAGMLGRILNGRKGEGENGRMGEREKERAGGPSISHSPTLPLSILLCALALLITPAPPTATTSAPGATRRRLSTRSRGTWPRLRPGCGTTRRQVTSTSRPTSTGTRRSCCWASRRPCKPISSIVIRT